MNEAEKIRQFKSARAGTVIVHRKGGVAVLSHRKGDGTGWWLTDNSGLNDWAFAGADWVLLDADAVAKLFAEETTTDG